MTINNTNAVKVAIKSTSPPSPDAVSNALTPANKVQKQNVIESPPSVIPVNIPAGLTENMSSPITQMILACAVFGACTKSITKLISAWTKLIWVIRDRSASNKK